MNFLEIFLGQLPEAIYFALFMILVKEVKEKRALFIVLNIIEYILLLNLFPYSIWSHILYFMLSYIIMKILYKEKTHITDIFTLGIASMVLVVISIVSYFGTIGCRPLFILVSRLFMFGFLFNFKDTLPNINKLYKKFWNRGQNNDTKIKSTTFRALNLVLFNVSFYLINLCMILNYIIKNRR